MPESSKAHPVPQDLVATVAPSSGVLRIPKGACASGVGSWLADAVLVPPPAGASLFRHPPGPATVMTRPSSAWKKGVRRRCERRGVGCKEPRRRRCRGASGRSGDAADGPAPPQPLGADGLLLAATEREEQQETPTEFVAAICKRPDATPASVFPRAACQAARFEPLTFSQRGRDVSPMPLTPALSRPRPPKSPTRQSRFGDGALWEAKEEGDEEARSSLNAEIAEEFHPPS